MKLHIALVLAACLPIALRPARCDEAADYAFLVAGLPSSLPASGMPGSVALLGYHSFPLIVETESFKDYSTQWAVAAAGFYGDAPAAGRAVVFAHACWSDARDGRGQLLENVLRWAGRKEKPVVGLALGSASRDFLQRHTWALKDFSPQLGGENDLSGVDVAAVDLQQLNSPQALSRLRRFAAQGGGLVLFAIPRWLNPQQHQAANELLQPFGLALSGEGHARDRYLISPGAYSPYFSAAVALDGLLADHAMLRRLDPQAKCLAADAVTRVLSSAAHCPALEEKLERLNTNYGWIQISEKKPLRVAQQPVEAMLVRYQAAKLDAMPASKLPVHPSAADWPGRVRLSEAISKTITITANAPQGFGVNRPESGLWVPTGLYARPGDVVTVTIPPDKTAAGLDVLIGVHVDENFHHDVWTRHPKIVRRDRLDHPVTETGCAFGGLVTIVVPPGAQLGAFPVTIRGAVEAPYFRYGATSDEEWVRRIRYLPGAWGVLESPSITLYVGQQHLVTLDSPNAVLAHWTRVIALADRYMGLQQRKRGEAALCDRQIVAGFGHDGYPVMMAYGDSSALIKEAVDFGDWGFYHELGHTYQRDFDGAYGICTTSEIDVNLVPGLLMTLLHHRLPADNNTYPTFDADERLRQRENFFKLPRDQQTWKNACEKDNCQVAPDFYFNLAEAFGWELYGRALGRIFRYSQNPAHDPEIDRLDRRDPNYLRNRLFLVLSQESGHNLTEYCQRYGLGIAPYGISQAVKDRVAKLPQWTGNRPVASLTNPGKLTVTENAAGGTPLYTFHATDPDPGTIFQYDIVAGNEDGAFSIDRTEGTLRVLDVDYERKHDYRLTVQVCDNAVPSTSLTQTFPVEVLNVPEPPKVISRAFSTQSWLPSGTVAGPVSVEIESGRTLQSLSLVSGNERGMFGIDGAGRLVVLRPDLLPGMGLSTVKVQAVDSAGQSDANWLYVVSGRPTGLNEDVWKEDALKRPPKKRALVADFQVGSEGEGYICKVSGYLIPPRSGLYTFWIAASDEGFLYLSSDVSPDNKKEIAKFAGRSRVKQWNKSPMQKSQPLRLEAGRIYYIEALQHGGSTARGEKTAAEHPGSENHLEAAWQGPGVPRQIIPTSALIPASVMRPLL